MSTTAESQTSLGGNCWQLSVYDERQAEAIAQKYNISPLIAQILNIRGISLAEVEDFINPRMQKLMPDPLCLKDMPKAALRIADAIEQQQTVSIIGDYDVDGATSSSVLRLFLESVGLHPHIHIPDREEGYGPSRQAVDEFSALGTDLIITVDCGTSAFDTFTYAKEKNIDVIVLDHHEAEVKLPDVYALINPKRLDEDSVEYLKYMAAVGVVFMAVVAVNRELRNRGFYNEQRPEPNLIQWLDLVALGTVCDVVPLLGLNRAYVRQGLKVMAQRRNIGLKSLIDKANISEAPGAFHLGYVIGPRINACGRVGDPALGNKLLCSQDELQAQMLADKLGEFNEHRKEIENYVLLQAIETLEGTPQTYPMAFVYGSDWHQGVVGIVAGKLKERYNVPAFVMSVEADEVKGSARSVPQIDLGALIISAKEQGLITKGGGHTMAAGFSLQVEQIEAFREFVGKYITEKIGGEAIVPILDIDAVLDVGGASLDLAEQMELLEPFGSGNPEPRVMLRSVRINKPSIIGNGHVRCFLSSNLGGGIKAIAFRVADNDIGNAMLNSRGDVYNVVGNLHKDTWQGRNSVQFIIEDIMRVK